MRNPTQLDEAEVIERMPLIPNDEPTEIAQPGEEPLDLPLAPVPPQGSAILSLGAFPVATVGRDHLHAQVRQGDIQGIGIVGAIPNKALGQCGYKTGFEGRRDGADLVRRSRGGTHSER